MSLLCRVIGASVIWASALPTNSLCRFPTRAPIADASPRWDPSEAAFDADCLAIGASQGSGFTFWLGAIGAVLTIVGPVVGFFRFSDRHELKPLPTDADIDLGKVVRRISQAHWRSTQDLRKDFRGARVGIRGRIIRIVPPDGSTAARIEVRVRHAKHVADCVLDRDGFQRVAVAVPGWSIIGRGRIISINEQEVLLEMDSDLCVVKPWWMR
jgi:hypothetical protein